MQDSYYIQSIQNKNSFEEYNQNDSNPFLFEDNYSIISDDYIPDSTSYNNNNINNNHDCSNNNNNNDINLLFPSFIGNSLSNTPKKTPNGLSKYLTSNVAIPALPISQPIESESINSQVVPTSTCNNSSNNLNSSSDFIIPMYGSNNNNNNNTNINNSKIQSPSTSCNNNNNNSHKNMLYVSDINEDTSLNNNQNIPMYNNKTSNANKKNEKKKNTKSSNNENINNNLNNYNINQNFNNNNYIKIHSYQNSPNYNNISLQEQEKMQLTSNCFNLIQYCNQLSYYTKQAYNNPYTVPEELDALSTLGNYIQFEISTIKGLLMKKPLKDQKIYQNPNIANSPRCHYSEQQSVLVPNSYSNSPLPANSSGYYSPLPESNNHSVFSSAVSSPFPTTNNSSPNIPPNKVSKKNQIKTFKQSTTYINFTENMIRAQTKKNKKSSNRVCLNCKTSDTPEWRKGPQGAKTLCNACGIRYRIQQQQQQQQQTPSQSQTQLNSNTDEYNNNIQSNNTTEQNYNYEDQLLKS